MNFPWKWVRPRFQQINRLFSWNIDDRSELAIPCNSHQIPSNVCVYNKLNWWQPSSLWEEDYWERKHNISSCIPMRTLNGRGKFIFQFNANSTKNRINCINRPTDGFPFCLVSLVGSFACIHLHGNGFCVSGFWFPQIRMFKWQHHQQLCDKDDDGLF